MSLPFILGMNGVLRYEVEKEKDTGETSPCKPKGLGVGSLIRD